MHQMIQDGSFNIFKIIMDRLNMPFDARFQNYYKAAPITIIFLIGLASLPSSSRLVRATIDKRKHHNCSECDIQILLT